MTAFRAMLALIFLAVVVYTVPVIMNHGMNLFAPFFSDMLAMGWAGQFNFDFMFMLLLSGFWIAWRHQFTPAGLGLGILGFFGGAPMLSLYLLIMSIRVDGDVRVLLLGEERAGA